MDHGVTFWWFILDGNVSLDLLDCTGSYWKFARHAWSVLIYILELISPFWKSHCDICICTGSGGHLFLPRFINSAHPWAQMPSALWACASWRQRYNSCLVFGFTKQAESLLFLVFFAILYFLVIPDYERMALLFSGSVFVNNPTLFTLIPRFFFFFSLRFQYYFCFSVWTVHGTNCQILGLLLVTFILLGVSKVEIYIVIYCITCYDKANHPFSHFYFPFDVHDDSPGYCRLLM